MSATKKRLRRTTLMLSQNTIRFVDGLRTSNNPVYRGRSRSDIIDSLLQQCKEKSA